MSQPRAGDGGQPAAPPFLDPANTATGESTLECVEADVAAAAESASR